MSNKENLAFLMKEFTNKRKHTYYSAKYCLVSVSLSVYIMKSQKHKANNCTQISVLDRLKQLAWKLF